jgi:hypothetical protein
MRISLASEETIILGSPSSQGSNVRKGPDCVKTRKLSEDGASGTNFYALPSPYWSKTAENQLKFINRGPAVRVFTRAGSKAATPIEPT